MEAMPTNKGYPAATDKILEAWNESDPTQRRKLLNDALTSDVRFVDPSIDLQGIESFEANISQVRAGLPSATFSRTSGVDSHHGFHRYNWAIHSKEKLVLNGYDVTEIDEQGKVVCVIGFFESAL